MIRVKIIEVPARQMRRVNRSLVGIPTIRYRERGTWKVWPRQAGYVVIDWGDGPDHKPEASVIMGP